MLGRHGHHGALVDRGFTLLELLTVLAMTVALISLGWPRWWEAPHRARAHEATAHLAVIQDALQRYGADHGGTFPDFLYGGEFSDDFATTESPRQSTFPGDHDVLLQEGYLGAYPANPFAPKTGARILQPRDWQLPRDPARVGWYADGGDRALHLASRRAGGRYGGAMVDLTEAQRHAPPTWAVPVRTETNRLVLITTPWRGVAQGNFVYHALYTGGGGYRWNPSRAEELHFPGAKPKAMGYVLWVYGPAQELGRDLTTDYGIPKEPWMKGPLARANGPDSIPDGIGAALWQPPGANNSY